MPDANLLFMPATKAAALVRAKKLSPVEYVETVLKAIDHANPKLNCFRVVMADEARRDAKAAEKAVVDGAKLGPLHGVPVSIKDLIDVAGIHTRHGSAIFEDNIATGDDVLVSRLRAAGAIVIGKATTPEFGVKGLTDGPSFGITRNPWNLERTPGGSSGGGAAAVAAGLGPLSLGTDGAGSVRGPASCCGLVGLKPTLGAVPSDATRDAFGNNVYAGPLTRTVTDAAVMHAVLTGPSAKDPWTYGNEDKRQVSPTVIGGDLSGVRVERHLDRGCGQHASGRCGEAVGLHLQALGGGAHDLCLSAPARRRVGWAARHGDHEAVRTRHRSNLRLRPQPRVPVRQRLLHEGLARRRCARQRQAVTRSNPRAGEDGLFGPAGHVAPEPANDRPSRATSQAERSSGSRRARAGR